MKGVRAYSTYVYELKITNKNQFRRYHESFKLESVLNSLNTVKLIIPIIKTELFIGFIKDVFRKVKNLS